MPSAFAERAAALNWSSPEFTDEPVIDIEGGRHPVVEAQVTPFIANDTRLSAVRRMLLITGPNMGGKSTYMRQTALIALLAHCGSFVPATRARLGPLDRIFTRIGAADDLARGQSTFMVEMSETANILNNASRKSLVILDEIGRGTSTFDGLSLAWSIVEHLHHQVGAKSLFATHYHELTELASPHGSESTNSQNSASERASGRLPRVRNYNVAVREWNDQIIFLRKIQPGPADKSYGIQVARLAGVPRPVIDRAKTLLRVLEEAELNLQHVAAPDSGSPGETDPSSGRSRRVRRLERDALQELTPPPQLDLFS